MGYNIELASMHINLIGKQLAMYRNKNYFCIFTQNFFTFQYLFQLFLIQKAEYPELDTSPKSPFFSFLRIDNTET